MAELAMLNLGLFRLILSPIDFYFLEKLRKAAAVDRRLTLREILERVFVLIPRFKSKGEMLVNRVATAFSCRPKNGLNSLGPKA